METREYTTHDRSEWSSGPWDDEPDKRQWADPDTSLPCLMVRNGLGAWCGYVGVAEGHPAFNLHYAELDVSVHGGLTYAASCDPAADEASGICHVPGPGEPDHVWWLGFDTAHAWDLTPATQRRFQHAEQTYRDQAYVAGQVASLALQLKALEE